MALATETTTITTIITTTMMTVGVLRGAVFRVTAHLLLHGTPSVVYVNMQCIDVADHGRARRG